MQTKSQNSQNTKALELRACCETSPNIALVKYWGKIDQDFILPINDSVGVTLDTADLKTTTMIVFTRLPEDTLLLNKINQKITNRVKKVLQLAKNKAYDSIYHSKFSPEEWSHYHFKIQSQNSFPTASGMASSASGLAALAFCLNNLFGNFMTSDQVSQLARLGSGSASRSIHGGLVRWFGVPNNTINSFLKNNKTKLEQSALEPLSKQCITKTVLKSQDLTDWSVLILLANWSEKQTTSTDGMKRTVETSELIFERNSIAARRVDTILSALKTGDFNTFVQTIIRDSNQFHALCLDTYPPIFYLNQFSKCVMHLVDHILNPRLAVKVAYTFDAGPHAFLVVHDSVLNIVFKVLQTVCTADTFEKGLNRRAKKYIQSNNTKQIKLSKELECESETAFKGRNSPLTPYGIWLTKVGNGPKVIP